MKGLLFDMDGVIARTVELHLAAWTSVINEVLSAHQDPRRPIEYFTQADFRKYVDGRIRYDGARNCLLSRGIKLPEGMVTDPPSIMTVCGVANKKNHEYLRMLQNTQILPYDSTVKLLREGAMCGLKIAIVSSSTHAKMICTKLGLTDVVGVIIDGPSVLKLGLAGKPAPDTYLQAARTLGLAPADCVVLEDAVSGVQSGKSGHFGLVLGIAREDNEKALLEAGADVVVQDLEGVNLKTLAAWYEKKAIRSKL